MRATALVLAAVCLSGCGRPAPPPVPAPAAPPQPPAPSPAPPARSLDGSVAELERAFADNPAAAREKYKDVRWRFAFDPTEFGAGNSVRGTVVGYGVCDVGMRSKGEAAKLSRGKACQVEATVERVEVRPGEGTRFVDAVVLPD